MSRKDVISLMPVDDNRGLEAILAAWSDATERLTQTHEALRAEVRRLTDELEAKNRELTRQARLADLGRMAAHVAHEVRNHLVPVKLYMNLMRRRLSPDAENLHVLEKIETGFTALETTVQDLLSFTSDRDPRKGLFPLRGMVEKLCHSLGPQFNAQRIEPIIDIDAEEYVLADADMLNRALMNLVLNAVDAMPDGGELTITAHQAGNWLEIEIADSGGGLPDNSFERLFEPFFTTKSGGTGLGLAIVRRVAEVHGGEIFAANCPEGGAAFTVRLPVPMRQALAA